MTKLMLALGALVASVALPIPLAETATLSRVEPMHGEELAIRHYGAALTQLGLAVIIGFAIGWARRATNRALNMLATILSGQSSRVDCMKRCNDRYFSVSSSCCH